MERLYLDTNVLFPMTLMDLLLAMAEDFHHDFLWSDFLLDEWERVIVRERHRTPEQASAITGAIRQAFPAGRIAPDDYEAMIETVPGPIQMTGSTAPLRSPVGATALITANLRHFDSNVFAQRGVIVETPESYLLRRLEHAPDRLLETVKRVVAMKTRPRWTLAEYLERVDRSGAPRFSSPLRARLQG